MIEDTIKNTRAIILAGGKGTRLWPLTAVFPKPLVPLGNKPVIDILLRRLASAGIRKATICTGYLAELLQAVCGDGSRFGIQVDYVGEEEPLGTAGPLALVKEPTDPVIVMNGDLLTTLNFGKMIEFHIREKADLTVGVFARDVKIDFGVVQFDGQGNFSGFQEKPTFHFDVSMGVNVISARAMAHVKRGVRMDMPDLVLKVHQTGGRVKCYQQNCRWLDIGRMDDYALAQDEFSKNETTFLQTES